MKEILRLLFLPVYQWNSIQKSFLTTSASLYLLLSVECSQPTFLSITPPPHHTPILPYPNYILHSFEPPLPTYRRWR